MPSDGNMTPGTLKSYLCGVQRVIRNCVGIKEFELFKMKDLMVVVDNKSRELQSMGLTTKLHNVLSISDVEKFWLSRDC